MIYADTRYTFSGRKRKKVKAKGEVCGKFKAPAFKELKADKTYQIERTENVRSVPSYVSSKPEGLALKQTTKQYTGNYVIGIATMHKSNAVPITNGDQAIDIARMRR
jgi:glucokinase